MLLRHNFWYLRHGETDWNRANRTQGSTDIPLNATGIAQAHDAAELLVGQGITALYCSPLQRARDTAAIVGARLGLQAQVRSELREASFGVHEGEVMGAWFAAWVSGDAMPERGESFAQVYDRAMAAMNAVLADGGVPLVVGHGGFFRTVRAAMGFTAAVRTANGVPLFCAPEGDGWRMESASGDGVAASG